MRQTTGTLRNFGSSSSHAGYYDYADELTPYGVAARYPSELGLEERHAKAALGHANELLDWAKKNCVPKDA